jgi:hypothetical protein
MKQTLLIVFFFATLFALGINIGILLDRQTVKENYFRDFPSPLSCHVENSCSLKDL